MKQQDPWVPRRIEPIKPEFPLRRIVVSVAIAAVCWVVIICGMAMILGAM